jgi:hypothetical protein
VALEITGSLLSWCRRDTSLSFTKETRSRAMLRHYMGTTSTKTSAWSAEI